MIVCNIQLVLEATLIVHCSGLLMLDPDRFTNGRWEIVPLTMARGFELTFPGLPSQTQLQLNIKEGGRVSCPINNWVFKKMIGSIRTSKHPQLLYDYIRIEDLEPSTRYKITATLPTGESRTKIVETDSGFDVKLKPVENLRVSNATAYSISVKWDKYDCSNMIGSFPKFAGYIQDATNKVGKVESLDATSFSFKKLKPLTVYKLFISTEASLYVQDMVRDSGFQDNARIVACTDAEPGFGVESLKQRGSFNNTAIVTWTKPKTSSTDDELTLQFGCGVVQPICSSDQRQFGPDSLNVIFISELNDGHTFNCSVQLYKENVPCGNTRWLTLHTTIPDKTTTEHPPSLLKSSEFILARTGILLVVLVIAVAVIIGVIRSCFKYRSINKEHLMKTANIVE